VLLGYGTERDVAAGEVLFADGDETYDLIVMPYGTADIIQGYGQPGARLVAGYGRSQFLGEIGMLTGQRRARGGRSAAQKMRRRAELPKRRESAKKDHCRCITRMMRRIICYRRVIRSTVGRPGTHAPTRSRRQKEPKMRVVNCFSVPQPAQC